MKDHLECKEIRSLSSVKYNPKPDKKLKEMKSKERKKKGALDAFDFIFVLYLQLEQI